MKRILAPILLLILLSPTLALGETMDDLVKRESLYYKKFSDVPFTGKVTGKTQGSIKNGKKHGPWVVYHDNGQLMSKGNYKGGKQDGPWVVYHDNGQLRSKGNYKGGKEDGPWVRSHDNGQLASKGNYKNGKEDGPWVEHCWMADGINEKGSYKDGKKQGLWFERDDFITCKSSLVKKIYKDGKLVSD